MNKEKEVEADEAKRGRSPSFPIMSLKKAIDMAEAISRSSGKAAARPSIVAAAWGYKETSSGFIQTISTLRQYGLIESVGSGQDRKLQLTDLAWRILKDARPGIKDGAIQEAVRKPKLMAECLAIWSDENLSDIHRISDLHIDRGFTEDAAKMFIKVFDENVEFANLRDSDNLIINHQNDGINKPSQSNAKAEQKPMISSANTRIRTIEAATLPMPEGMVVLELPYGLSKESQEDLRVWFDLMLKRASRPVTQKEIE